MVRCAHCGEPQQHYWPPNKKYCSQRCAWRAWKARQPPRPGPVVRCLTCEMCGAEFASVRRRRFCGAKCAQRNSAKRERVRNATNPCEHCGTLTHNKRFCSRRCFDSARRASSPPAGRACSDCGLHFVRRGSVSVCAPCSAVRAEDKRNAREEARRAREASRYPKVSRGKALVRVSKRPKVRTFVAGICLVCGDPFVAFAHTGSRFCSTACGKRADRQARRDRKRAAEKTVRIYRRKVFERDNWTCRLCRKPVQQGAVVPHPKAPTVDHILPLALGGSHTAENVQTAHFICNSKKSQNVTQLSFAA
jgi:hypothetical protein